MTLTPPRAPRRWLGTLTLIACAALWSLNGPLIKLLNQQAVPGITTACYRSLIGGLVFLPFALRRMGTLGTVPPAWPLAAVLIFTLMTASFVIANTMTAAANAIILQYTSPIWVFLLSPLILSERPARAEGLALLISMAGVAIIFAGNPDTNPAGLLVALTSGFGYGTLTVLLRRLRTVNPVVVSALNTLGSGVLLIGPVAVWGRYALTGQQWSLMLFLGLVQFTLPYLLFSWALRHVEAHRAALILLLETLLNPIWTYCMVGEVPPLATVLGGPLILAGVLLSLALAWRRSRSASSARVVVPATP
jgi:drug/metabolite transporter (DMT)-like permease